MIFAGHWIVHGTTVTVNVQLAVLLDVSVTVQVTVVTPGVLFGPTGKQNPDGGTHTTVASGQLSPNVGANFTIAQLVAVVVEMLAGQLIVGSSVSLTVTVNEQVPELFAASLTVQLTVVTPFGKVDPDGGVQDGVPTPGQLSVAVGAE